MDAQAIQDIFSPVIPVRVRRMFGGFGVFDGEMMFALVFDGTFFLKTTPATRAHFAAAGSAAFVYRGRGRERDLGYRRLPEAALDDPDELARWTKLAVQAALDSARLRRRGSRPRPLPP